MLWNRRAATTVAPRLPMNAIASVDPATRSRPTRIDQASAVNVHDPPGKGPDQDRRQPGNSDDEPDPDLVGAKLEQVSGKVDEKAAAQLRSAGRKKDEREPAREEGLADHRDRF